MGNQYSPVVIIGGGIGGLTFANALQHLRIPFELYERAPVLTEVGAGIGITTAPLKILDQFNLGDVVRESGARVKKVFVPDKNLNIRRSIVPTSEMICIHRAKLIEILKSKLPADHIHLSKEVTALSSTADETEIQFRDGTNISSKVTVAADGINSICRQHIFPELKVRYVNQTIWRGVTNLTLPEPFKDSYFEIWDERLRYLAIPLSATQTLWLAVQSVPPGGEDNPKTVRDDLQNLFSNFHPFLRKLIDESENVLRNDMTDLGTQKREWFKNRLVFLGDSIHATTPNMAQGGCQAIEDAWCLALCLKKYGEDVEHAFKTYSTLRKPKVRKVVSNSWWFGKAAHSNNPILHYGFRAILTHTPASFLRKQEAFLNDLSYLDGLGFN